MSARLLLKSLRGRGVTLETDGEQIRVDAPAGVMTGELRTALAENKPGLIHLLSREAVAHEEAFGRGLLVRWSEYPTWIRLHDPTTGEWHEVKASECLPSIVANANRHRTNGGAA